MSDEISREYVFSTIISFKPAIVRAVVRPADQYQVQSQIRKLNRN